MSGSAWTTPRFLERVTAPTGDVVSLTDLKAHGRIGDALYEGDQYGANLLDTAETWVEQFLGRSLLTQTWRAWFDEFPACGFQLDKGPVQSVTSITYYDTTDTSATVNASIYQVDTVREPGLVSLKYSQQWPTTILRPSHNVAILFSAGYGAAASSVPFPIRHAIVLLANHWYTVARDPYLVNVGTNVQEVPLTIHALLQPYRLHTGTA